MKSKSASPGSKTGQKTGPKTGPKIAEAKTPTKKAAGNSGQLAKKIVTKPAAAGKKAAVKRSASSTKTLATAVTKPPKKLVVAPVAKKAVPKAVPKRVVKPVAKQVARASQAASGIARPFTKAPKAATPKAPTPKAPTPKAPTPKVVPAQKPVGKTKQVAPTKSVVVTKPSAPKPAPQKSTTKLVQKPVAKAQRAAQSTSKAANTFAALGIPADVLAALDKQGIASPFPIQTMTIPDGLAGRDVCGQAKTGSGKTLAFGIPLVARLKGKKAAPRKPLSLVLVPTRELAAQVERELIWLAKPGGHNVVSIYGGVSMDTQREKLLSGSEIVVATPGRLIDLLGRGDIDLGSLEFLVVDEADRMCDMGFMPNLEWLLRKMPRSRQTLLFSATLGSDVNSLIKHELRDPVRHVVESATTTVDSSVHHFFQVHQMDKSKVVASILRANDRGIVFLNTKRACDRLADELKEQGLTVRAIHGDLSQDQRNRALKQFISGQIRALVATDVAARGLHIDGVDVVIQADIPDDHKTYLHRAGRTARAGATGVVATLAVWNQLLDLERLQKRLGMNVKPVELFSNDQRLTTLAEWKP
jgi:superfamily II DNA/RNA helicase